MDISFFKDKKITVFGLGLHGGGVGVVKFLVKHGARVIATDIKTKEELKPSLKKLEGLKNIEYVLGQHRQEDFIKVDMVIKNPGISWNNAHIKLALEHNVPVEMDSSLFFKMCRNPIIGVTGTKGKTTTSTLIYEIFKLAGKNVVRVGLGQISVLDRLELLKKDSWVVFELSSWRLSALGRNKLSPQIAVITNLYPDHLNYYSSMEEYFTDKQNIFLFQKCRDWLVVNGDQPILSAASERASSQVIRFCFSCPKNREGRFVYSDGESIYLNDGIDEKKIMAVKSLRIAGEHNVPNVMAAIGAAYAAGVDLAVIRKAIVDFICVPHRLEFVREVRGVKYYNDTSATIPQATLSALHVFKDPVILIAGGSDKKLDFSELAGEIFAHAKGLVLLKGDATEKLVAEIIRRMPENERERRFEIVNSINKAVEFASQIAEKGDIVLLSPGAASFGMFANEFDRGDKFREAVKGLKQ